MGFVPEYGDEGVYSFNEVSSVYKHYGVHKWHYIDGEEGYDYNKEIEFLTRCIKAGKMFTEKEIRKISDKIVYR